MRRNEKRMEDRPARPLPRDPVVSRRTWAFRGTVVVLVLCAIGAVLVEQYGSAESRIYAKAIDTAVQSFLKWLGAIVAILFAGVLLLLWLRRDPVMSQVARLCRDQRLDDGQRLLKEHIAAKGETFDRLNALGLICMEQSRWDEAMDCFERAEKLRSKPGELANNRALVLWKSGRLDEAIPVMREARRMNHHDFVTAANFCLLLIDAGRRDEAFAELDAAEMIFNRYDRRYTKAWVEQLEECRQKLNVARGFPVQRVESESC